MAAARAVLVLLLLALALPALSDFTDEDIRCHETLSDYLCKKDPGCYYDEGRNQCMSKKNKELPCDHVVSSYDCKLHPHCAYDSQISRCHNKGRLMECEYYDKVPETCKARADCHIFQGNCISRNHKLPCRVIPEAEPCNIHDKSCAWDDESAACRNITLPRLGVTHHCHVYRNRESCSSPECKYISNVGCVSKDFFAPCDMMNDADDCVSNKDCEYIKPVEGSNSPGFCSHKGFPVACHRYQSSMDCDEDERCEYNYNIERCLTQGTVLACDVLTNELGCGSNPACVWHKALQMCTEEGATLPCHSITDPEICKDAGCEFKVDVCLMPGAHKECEEFEKASECNAHKCQWIEDNEDIEGGETNGYCSAPVIEESEPDAEQQALLDKDKAEQEALAKGPVFDKPKKRVTKEDCKKAVCEQMKRCPGESDLKQPLYDCCPRCSYSSNICSHHYNAESCNEHCEWHPDLFQCTAVGEDPPCNFIHTKDGCTLRSHKCTWHEGADICIDKDEPTPCYMVHDKFNCKGDCEWHAKLQRCKGKDDPLDCTEYRGSEMCAEVEEHCDWHAEASFCFEKGLIPPCNMYTDKVGCEAGAENCHWVDSMRTCLDKNETPDCTLFDNKEMCNSHDHCEYLDAMLYCRHKAVFKPLPCHAHDSRQECLGNEAEGCEWHEDAMACFKKGEDIDCHRVLVRDGCEARDDCKFVDATFTCEDKDHVVQCDAIDDEARCKKHGAELGCAWETEHHVCYNEAHGPPCHIYSDSEECDETEECYWLKSSMMCVDLKNPSALCNSVHDLAGCLREDLCRWLPGVNRCQAMTDPVLCNELDVFTHCDTMSDHCEWDQVDNACVEKGRRVDCLKVLDARLCDHMRVCAYDYKRHRCRPLVKPKYGGHHDEL